MNIPFFSGPIFCSQVFIFSTVLEGRSGFYLSAVSSYDKSEMDGFDQRGTSSAFGSSPSGSVPRPPNRLNAISQMGFGENLKHGIPPSHPNTNISPSSMPYPQFMASQSQSHSGSQHRHRSPNFSSGSSSPSHSRSLSQSSFFSLDSLPPLSPSPAAASPFADSVSMDMAMEENMGGSHGAPSVPANRGHALQLGHSLPPRKGHRRSSSDTPLGISDFYQSYHQFFSPRNGNGRDNSASRGESSGFENQKPIQLVLKEPNNYMDCFDGPTGESMGGKKEDVMDDLFSAYMNLDNIHNINFPGVEDKDLDSRTSGSKTVESSDNEVESHASVKTTAAHRATSNYLEERKEGVKRSSNGDIAPGARHRRSFSLDSSIGNFHIEDGLPKLPPFQNRSGPHSPSNSMDGKTPETGIEFGTGEFSAEEMKKIMESDKLAEIAMSDPKRAKRILANRLSAARSKERKTRYISELEKKVQTLQAETTTLSTQFTKLQMDHTELKSLNNEYKLRLQALEQQSHLKDALNETLDAEVRRLRHTVAELGGESLLSTRLAQQLSINQQRYQLQRLQQQQTSQHGRYQPQSSHAQAQTQIQHEELQSQRQNGKTTAY